MFLSRERRAASHTGIQDACEETFQACRTPHARIGLGTEGRVTPVRHRDRATQTQQTAHPQLHAGKITPHPATVSMLRARRGRGIPKAPYRVPATPPETVYMICSLSTTGKKVAEAGESVSSAGIEMPQPPRAKAQVLVAFTDVHLCLIPLHHPPLAIQRGNSVRVRWVLCAPLTFVLRTSSSEGPSPSVLILLCTAFPCSDSYAPSDCLLGLGVFVGVSLTYFSPPSFASLTPHLIQL